MIEKLLELILHAKAGAISGILLIGASGALVSATTQNGVTTITVTHPSASPSASVSPSPSPSASPSASPSVSPSPSPSASPSASPRSDRACVEAVQAVNETFKRHHGALAKLHGHDDTTAKSAKEDARQALKQADGLLKGIRKAAVKAIHESCGKHDDDDEDHEDEDEDSDKDEDDEDKDGTHSDKDGTHHRAEVSITFTGTPSEMAQQAGTAMEIVMSALRTKLEALPTATPKVTPKPSLRPSPKPSKSPHASTGHSRG